MKLVFYGRDNKCFCEGYGETLVSEDPETLFEIIDEESNCGTFVLLQKDAITDEYLDGMSPIGGDIDLPRWTCTVSYPKSTPSFNYKLLTLTLVAPNSAYVAIVGPEDDEDIDEE